MDRPDDVIREFLIETREYLDQFDIDVIALQRDPSFNDILARTFRTIHTIKGASGFLNFTQLETIAHAGEGLLSHMREGNLRPNADMTSTLLDMADFIRSVLANIEATGEEGAIDPQLLTRRIECLRTPDAASDKPTPKFAVDSVTSKETSCDLTESDGAKPIGQLMVERAGVDRCAVAAARESQRRGDLRTLGEILVSQGAVSPSLARSVVEYQQQAREAIGADSRVRVDVARLDHLFEMVGELVLIRDEILQTSRQLCDPGLSAIARRLDHVTTEIQRESKLACARPIGSLLGRLPRLAWDLALAGGKQVRLTLEGQDVELDISVLEAIKDPLMHLVRNAVDHGIEATRRRQANGKPPEGCITVRASIQGDEVWIEVSDDGAGIDLARVKCAAILRGLLPAEQADRMTDEEIARFVFLHGVTTAEHVTTISGRGVGMDVVKTNVEKIGGSVDLRTQLGAGTKVTLRIPRHFESAGERRHRAVKDCCEETPPQAVSLRSVRLNS